MKLKLPEGFGRFEKEGKTSEDKTKSEGNEGTSQKTDAPKQDTSDPSKKDSGTGREFNYININIRDCNMKLPFNAAYLHVE